MAASKETHPVGARVRLRRDETFLSRHDRLANTVGWPAGATGEIVSRPFDPYAEMNAPDMIVVRFDALGTPVNDPAMSLSRRQARRRWMLWPEQVEVL